jgi:hypothetical protein
VVLVKGTLDGSYYATATTSGTGAQTIFWPPGPLPLTYDSSISDSGGGFGRGGRAFARETDVVVNVRMGNARGETALKRTVRRERNNVIVVSQESISRENQRGKQISYLVKAKS